MKTLKEEALIALIAFFTVLASVGTGLNLGNKFGTRVGHVEGYSQGFADGRKLGMAEEQTPEYAYAEACEAYKAYNDAVARAEACKVVPDAPF